MLGGLNLFNILKICCLKYYHIFAKSFIYPISSYFAPLYGLDNG